MDRLLYAMEIVGNQKVITPTDTHWRNSRNFRCMHCEKFKLNFEKDEQDSTMENTYYCINERKTREHGISCNVTEKLLSKGIHVIEES